MASVIKSVSFDAADALRLARFWAAAFGSDLDEESTSDKAFVEAAGWGGPNIWFTRVPAHLPGDRLALLQPRGDQQGRRQEASMGARLVLRLVADAGRRA